MAEQPERDQQTEAPTQKRRDEARRNGDLLQSRELAVALIMLAGCGWVMLIGRQFVEACQTMVRAGLNFDRGFDLHVPVITAVRLLAWPLASLFGLAIIASLAGPAALGSLGFRGNALAFKANRLNPANGLKRMFGPQGLIELGKAIIKVLMLGGISYVVVTSLMPELRSLGRNDVRTQLPMLGEAIVRTLFALGGGLALIAMVDVPIQWTRRTRRLRMTRQQVKEELRQSDGAPELKAMQRQRQHEILAGSARKAVTEATVILTNPTHFAVALRYRPEEDAAPVVVARGRGEVALAIRQLARDNGLPTLDYPQLTRAIYFSSRAGQPIAEDLFLAVATILAFVLNLDRALAHGLTPPPVTVPPGKRFDEHGRRARGT